MKKSLIIALICIFCSSCALWHSKGNSDITDLSDSSFQSGKNKYKTKSNIEKNLGKPNAIFMRNGYETYEYNYVYYGTRIWNAIPILAIFMSAPSVEVSVLYVSFDKEGNVISYHTDTQKGIYNKKKNKIYDCPFMFCD